MLNILHNLLFSWNRPLADG